MKTWLKLICFGLMPLITLHGFAEVETNDEEIARYRVELIIFKRNYLEPYADAEHWRKDLVLAYPENIAYLKSVDETATSDANEQPPASPHLFILPADARNLKESAAAIDRQANMEVLFHEIWIQDLNDNEQASAIIIANGKEAEDYRALNGWIKLSIARYLHIQTDLWLVDYVQNNGQLPEFWPAVPPLPIESSEEQADRPDDIQTSSMGDQNTVIELEANNPFFDFDDTVQPYLVDRIYTLKQKRRMRSGELHYLDHPKLGLLIKLEAVEEE